MRYKRSFLLVLCLVGMGLMLLPSRLPTQGVASCPPYEFVCDFYDQCLDKMRPCGEDGYAAWASTWCKEMHSQAVLHMPSAARFVPEFFKCLTQDITKRVEEQAMSSCTDLRSVGIIGYRACMSGREATSEGLNFCDLTLEDWQRILGTIELGDGIIHPKDITAAIIKECSHCIAAQLLHGTGGNKDSLTRLSWLRTVLDGLPRAIRDEVLAAKIKLPS